MNSDRIHVLLEMIPQEELVNFFRSNKTQISCMDEPHTFLNQLRDNSLVPEDLYQKVIKMRNKERRQCGVYQILEWLEKQGGQCIKKFWRFVVFQDHILKKYSALRLLQASFLDGSFRVIENPSGAEKPTGSEEKETEQEKGGTKRKKGNDETEEEETCSSSMSGPSQKRPAMEPTFLESTGSQPFSRSTQSSKDPLDQIKDDSCFICNEEEILVHCTQCPRAFHYRCHLPMLQEETLGDSWMCTFCVLKTNQQLKIQMRREDILNSPVSGNIRHCEYLLLCMYKGDALHVFTANPTITDAEWSSVISEPMWLDKVKTKLQDNKYRTVGEFVRDINLIFKNCQTLNSDNEFGKMGAKLNKIFEREFQTIFNIQNNWMCTFCVLKTNHRLWDHMSREGALSSPVSRNLMRCEYLLLHLYKADTQRVFTDDPSTKVERYRNVISNPMWLDKVKTKLKNNKYKTDNPFGRMGAKMKKIFQKEFDTIFKLQ